jgi:hypothetical protein
MGSPSQSGKHRRNCCRRGKFKAPYSIRSFVFMRWCKSLHCGELANFRKTRSIPGKRAGLVRSCNVCRIHPAETWQAWQTS